MLEKTLSDYRARYDADVEAAAALIAVGESMAPEDIKPQELAAWTMLANAVLCSDAAIVKD